MLPFKFVYGKPCNLPVELEYKAFWGIKKLNIDWVAASNKRFLELNEIEQFWAQEYENAKLYKKKTKMMEKVANMEEKYEKVVFDVKEERGKVHSDHGPLRIETNA